MPRRACEALQHLKQLFPVNNSVLPASLVNGLVPAHEEDFILLSNVCKISNSDLFKFPLNICQVILAILVLTLRPKLPEDVI